MEIIKLNIIPNGITPICHASQFDIKRKIGIALFDNMDPYNLSGEETVSLSVRKPDKTIITKTLEIESGNYIEFETTEQMCAIAGENKCEIKISYDDMTIGSLNFIMQVERDPLFKGIQSESEIENLQEQVNTAVATAVSGQYDSENVIFDSEPTLNNNIPYTVTSDGIKRALNQKADLSALSADNISFDNTGSGLSATDVDEAIKELESDIPEIPSSYAASAVTYDNTQSGLSSNNAQDAIDEVKGDLDGAVSAIGTALSGKADSSSLAAVATSGDYSDLSNKPTIDSALDADSENAVQNKAIATAINDLNLGKQSRLYTKSISITGATGTAWTPHYYCDIDISSYFTGVDANAGILAVTINQQTSGGVLCAMLQGPRTIRLLNDQAFTNIVCNITCLYYRP